MGSVERILSDTSCIESETDAEQQAVGVHATLANDFTYRRWDGVEVTLCMGSSVLVDQEKNIACNNDDYFSVEQSDYRISFEH